MTAGLTGEWDEGATDMGPTPPEGDDDETGGSTARVACEYRSEWELHNQGSERHRVSVSVCEHMCVRLSVCVCSGIRIDSFSLAGEGTVSAPAQRGVWDINMRSAKHHQTSKQRISNNRFVDYEEGRASRK